MPVRSLSGVYPEEFREYGMFKIHVCISNNMFGRDIWGKLSECIFENFEMSETRAIQNFQKSRVIYPKNRQNQACDFWLIITNQQTLCIETDIF